MDRIIIITIVILTSIVQLSTPTRRSIGTPSPPIGWNRTSGLPRSSMLRGGPRRKRERAPISRQQQYNCGVCCVLVCGCCGPHLAMTPRVPLVSPAYMN